MSQTILRAVLVAGVVTFGASTAFAQFGFIFGDPPPRPPGQVPGGGYGGPGGRGSTPRCRRGNIRRRRNIHRRIIRRRRRRRRATSTVAGSRPPRGRDVRRRTAARHRRGTAAPPPPDDEIIGPPTTRIVHPTAHFSGLDKITGRIINFPVDIGETVQFGALQLTTRACYTRPADETANTDAFVEVDEVTLAGRGEAHLHRLDVRRRAPACTRSSIRSTICG